MDQPEIDAWHMARALELAAQGRGCVEPNPMVGSVVARGAESIGEGRHERFGGPHAEVNALAIAGERARGATLYVTLEPCCHQGKTPPCTRAIIASGVRRVAIAHRDPFPAVSGKGIAELEAAGIEVVCGVLEDQARRLNAPYLKLLATGRSWVIAKWAMTLDGKLATRSGDSRWISGEDSREIVHEIRGRVDAILIGRGTAQADDPLLTARPPGPRIATRIVLDTQAALSLDSQLVRTARAVPLLVAHGETAPADSLRRLAESACETFLCSGNTPDARLSALLDELGCRRMTNVLVEGGSHVLGILLDGGHVDEVHVFIAPRLACGGGAPSPIAGRGVERMVDALRLDQVETRMVGDDVYVTGRTVAPPVS